MERWPEPVARGLAARASLPVEVQERMAAHESRQVRSALARHVGLAPALRGRLLTDPDWRVRVSVFSTRHPLPAELLIPLMTDLLDPADDVLHTSNELFAELFFADWKRVAVAARHPDPRVRRAAVPNLRRDDLPAMLDDPDPEVASAAAATIAEHERIMQPADLPEHHCHAFWHVLERPLSPALAEQVATSDDVDAVRTIARNPTLSPALVESLSHHPAAEVRVVIAGRAGLTADQVAALEADPDDAVRQAVANHAYVSQAEQAILDGQADLEPELASLWARSANPRLRRRAAQRADLRPEVVERLAADPDAEVRATLALNSSGASGELLLGCFLEGWHRTQLLARPQFPRAGLARFADHPDPRVRDLVAHDPAADPAVIDLLTTDPDVFVRRTMARCPRLPGDRLVTLLDDAELAADAAANPSLNWRSLGIWEGLVDENGGSGQGVGVEDSPAG
ncbi:hypothetical protein M1L60_13195 [Actinoplanes sp. TRM 88003]|uniref:Leucine rich repeat variant n=1 Tax=Paractinoplanes aksuensis TaxID=2939490 RepID=A0ABT1DL37_9ACTN|nr:hypothetical protein [Actinoplanes aksuensis]MCO8271549.1 hypothetical protein [Actinoplanes aksuensis]